MVAAPSTADYGRLSVMLQWRYAMEKRAVRAARVLRSAAQGGQRCGAHGAAGAAGGVDEGLLSEMVQVAFSPAPQAAAPQLGKWLQEKGFGGSFDVQRRAEEMPVAEYIALSQALRMRKKPGTARLSSLRAGVMPRRASNPH